MWRVSSRSGVATLRTAIHLLFYLLVLLLLLHPFNGLFSGTAWVSRYQKGKTSLDLNEAEYDGGGVVVSVAAAGPRCRRITTPNNTSSLNFYRPVSLPNAQRTVSKRGMTIKTIKLLFYPPLSAGHLISGKG